MPSGFVTAAYIYLDNDRRETIAASAGHPKPILARSGEETVRGIGGNGPISVDSPLRATKRSAFASATEIARCSTPTESWKLGTPMRKSLEKIVCSGLLQSEAL